MANHHTNFSAVFDVKTAENVKRALEIYAQDCDEEHGDPYEDNFFLEREGKEPTSELWIHADVSGSPDSVADFVIRCAREFDLNGLWALQWSHTCDKPRIDNFGGGALIIDLKQARIIDCINTEPWVQEQLHKALAVE